MEKVADCGDVGGDVRKGYEKFVEFRLSGRATSETLSRFETRREAFACFAAGAAPRSKLTPRPPAGGVGDVMRIGGGSSDDAR